jgi:hypothetical protein
MKAILTLVAASLAAMALAVSASAADRYIPFVTDFPRASQSERYVPFVTDFPRASESERYVPSVTDSPSYVPEAAPAGVAADVTGGFDWLDAAFGAAGGFGLGALAAASLLALRRRTSVLTT